MKTNASAATRLAHLAKFTTGLGAATMLLTGCISNETTVYRDVERSRVEFENESAARIFYEALSQRPPAHNTKESKTEVSLPIVFEHKQRVITGQNGAFNEAVMLCDTNKDGKISELEAKIFAAAKPKA